MAQMISEFRVQGELGRGGQGVVFRVDDPRIPGKQWALKQTGNRVLHDRERQALAALGPLADPAVPRLVNAFTWQGTFVLVMTCFSGQTLVGRRMPWRSAVRAVARLAALLERIHQAGWLYLDLKPENVLLGDDGQLHVIDYASAQPLASALSAGEGTPGFAAPEQMTRGSRLSSAADAYALGALGWYLLTGNAPIPGARLGTDVPSALQGALQSLISPDSRSRLPLAQVAALSPDVLEREMTRCGSCQAEFRAAAMECPQCGERAAPLPRPAPVSRLLPPPVIGTPGGNSALILAELVKPAGQRTAFVRELRLQAERIARVRGFDRLEAPERLRHLIEFYPHQLDAALKALRDLRGNAVLADEVGLGKTIEAGLVIKELLLRGLVKRALIVVPPHLTDQWAEEMHEKFGLPFAVYSQPADWQKRPFLIASLNLVGRHAETLKSLNQPFDLIVVDEMHNLLRKNGHPRVVYEHIAQLQRKYMLLLSATAVRRYLHELFYLISLIRPGTFASIEAFRLRFDWQNGRSRTNVPELRAVLQEFMIRNHRANMRADHLPPPRQVEMRSLPMSAAEDRLWQETFAWLRREPKGRSRLSPAFSSPASQKALLYGWPGDLGDCEKLREVIRILDLVRDRVIIFTREKTTAEALANALRPHYPVVLFVPGLASSQKAERFHHFKRTPGSVLVATDQAAEGRNLQFASHLINFDIPWNPLRLEQRIGRVDRIGQRRVPKIYNLSYQGTFEDQLLRVYANGLRMFDPRLIIGELASVLELADLKGAYGYGDEDLETVVSDLWTRLASDPAGLTREMGRLEALLRQARTGYDEERRREQEIDRELF